jgi:ABC-2 type transport system permease protein
LNEDQMIDTLIKMFDWQHDIYPYKKFKPEADLESENFHFVRLLKRDNGKQTFLRVYNDPQRLPSEAEISAAFKRLVMDSLPTVGFLTGHGERRSDAEEDRGYNMFAQEKTFRYALINQGFDFANVTLDKEIPSNIRILLIAEVRRAMAPEEMARLNNYIDRGGNLIIAGEPGRLEFINPLVARLGVTFQPGMLVKPTKKFQPNLILQTPTPAAEKISYHFRTIRRNEMLLPMPTATAVSFTSDSGFSACPLFTSDTTGGWIEHETTNFIDDTAVLNTNAGEEEKPYPTVLAVSRPIQGDTQKIIVMGDADCLSNGELMMNRKDVNPANFSFISGMFHWLTDRELPIDMRRPPPKDNGLYLGKTSWAISKQMLKWIFPVLLMLCGTLIWVRRKRR